MTMARVAKSKETIRSAAAGRKPGRPASNATKTTKVTGTAKPAAAVAEAPVRRKPGRPPKAPLVAVPSKVARTPRPPARSPVENPTPKLSKDELRARVEKLEQTVATLRAKSREANKAAKAAAARIAELEEQAAQLEQTAAPPAPPVDRQPRASRSPRTGRRSREIDPGDAVPPGVAVQEPAPLDEEAETALENLEEHLGRG
jgi:hypothetical protein